MTDELKAFVEAERARWARELASSANARLLAFADTVLGRREPELADPRQMEGKPGRLWFPGLEARPWHDPRDYPWLAGLEESFPSIRAELAAVAARLAAARTSAEARPDLTNKGWRELPFWRYEDAAWLGKRGAVDEGTAANRASCPRTVEALTRLPFFGNAGFSQVDPGGHITPHHSNFNGRITFQLSLVAPRGAWIAVQGERRTWSEGKTLVFDDTYVHEVRNESGTARIILLFDAWHHGLTRLEVAELSSLFARAAALGAGRGR